jgi:hypothetical protein
MRLFAVDGRVSVARAVGFIWLYVLVIEIVFSEVGGYPLLSRRGAWDYVIALGAVFATIVWEAIGHRYGAQGFGSSEARVTTGLGFLVSNLLFGLAVAERAKIDDVINRMVVPDVPDVFPALVVISAAAYSAAYTLGRRAPRIERVIRLNETMVEVRGRDLVHAGRGATNEPPVRVEVGGLDAQVVDMLATPTGDRVVVALSGTPAAARFSLRLSRSDGQVASAWLGDEEDAAGGEATSSRSEEPVAAASGSPLLPRTGGGPSTPPAPPGGGGPVTSGEPERDAGSPTRLPWDLVLQIVGAGTALAAWIAVVGGARVWARLDAAELPATQTLSRLPQRLFVVEGLQTLLLPLLLGGFVAMTVAFTHPRVEPGPTEPEQAEAAGGAPPGLSWRRLAPIDALQRAMRRYGVPVVVLALLVWVVLLVIATLVIVGAAGWAIAAPLTTGFAFATALAFTDHVKPAAVVAGVAVILSVLVPVFVSVTSGYAIAIPVVTVIATWFTLGALAHASTASRAAWILFASVAAWAGAVGYIHEAGARAPRFDELDTTLADGTRNTDALVGRADGELLVARRDPQREGRFQVAVLDRDGVKALAYGPPITLRELPESGSGSGGSSGLGGAGPGGGSGGASSGGGSSGGGSGGGSSGGGSGGGGAVGAPLTPSGAEQQSKALASDETTIAGVRLRLDIVSARRMAKLVIVDLRLVNVEPHGGPTFGPDSHFSRAGASGRFDGPTIVDAAHARRYAVGEDSHGDCLCTDGLDTMRIAPGGYVALTAMFGAPPEDVDEVALLVPSFQTREITIS